MTTIDPVFSLMAEDLALLSDEQLEEMSGAVDRLRQLVTADRQRRRDELSSKFEVLGKDATATCLRHRRRVRWIPAPGWWIHDDDLPHVTATSGDPRSCSAMWDAKAPIVITRLAD